MSNNNNQYKWSIKGEILLAPKGLNWAVANTVIVESDKWMFSIPKNFETDLASVPRVLWTVLPPYGDHTIAAIAHDRIYRCPSIMIPRNEADLMFKDLMIQYGVSSIKAELMYRGVQAFGWTSYRERSK